MEITAVVAEVEERTSPVFVDASGRRARRMQRAGFVLGAGCIGYIAMVALGLSGTRVGALPGVPSTSDHRVIAGLAGVHAPIGLRLTPNPSKPYPTKPYPTKPYSTKPYPTEAYPAARRPVLATRTVVHRSPAARVTTPRRPLPVARPATPAVRPTPAAARPVPPVAHGTG